ncbi:MAG: YecA family protein [bacterium]
MKIGRNDPCPCGSGKKYKKCCLIKSYTATAVGREELMQRRLIKNLIDFYYQNYGETIELASFLFWEDFNPADYLKDASLERANINFTEYIIFDFIVNEENDKTLIDSYIETYGNSGNSRNSNLSFEEIEILKMMKNSYISLFQVKEVFEGQGLFLEDILINKEYDVSEKLATESLSKYDILATRLLYLDGKYIMSGSGYPYPLIKKQEILNEIKLDYKYYKKEYPNTTIAEYLKKNGNNFNTFWCEMFTNPKPFIISNMDGDPILFSKAVFDIKDKNTLINSLKSIKDFIFNVEDNSFTWVDDTPGRKLDSTSNGIIEIKDNRLTVECNSKERLSKAKKLIIENAQNSVVHKADVFQDPAKAISEFSKNNGKQQKEFESEIPKEIQQEIINKFLTENYEKWLNEKIPALDGKTPLEAIKTKKGKKQVIELLQFYENIEEKNKKDGKAYYDFSWLWERLGLAKK